jgi:NADPH:quinone reductase-like Zn-dependent oxidoreductase
MDGPTTQKQYRLVKTGGQRLSLQLTDAPVRAPEADEVLVKMRAASINRRDIYAAFGAPNVIGTRESLVPLSDGAGEVVTLGARVTRLRIGDRVAPGFFEDWVEGRLTAHGSQSGLGGLRNGVLTQYLTIKESSLAVLPGNLSFEEGATLPCAAVTAWEGLFNRGDLRAGDFVLLQGTGGVSVFGLQLSAAAGAKPIILSSSDEKLERARSLGAFGTVNYQKTPDWETAVRDLTGGIGVHHVLEVGGTGSIAKSIASLALNGHIALIGGLSTFGGEIPVLSLIGSHARASGILVGSRKDFDALNAFIQQNKIKPVIDRVFDFQDAPAAYELMESNRFFGKIVVRI